MISFLQALLCLPEMERPNYDHLVAQPTLLLEQLLMNRKVGYIVTILSGHTEYMEVLSQ